MITPSRSQIIRRVVVYIAMTISVLTLSTLLVFAMLGYRYNQQQQTFIQGGLVQFISEPLGARVRVGEVDLANQTRSKITLNPGDYTVKMSRDGYRDWTKDITVKAGTVLWLNSARLIPNDIETKSVLELPKLGSVAMQERGQNIILLPDASKPELQVIKSNDTEPEPRTVTLPTANIPSEEGQTFRLVRQSGDNRHLLMTQTYGETTRWIVADIDRPEDSYVIATDQGLTVSDVQLDPSSDSRAYVLYSDGSTRRLEVGSGERSEVLVSNIASFTITSRGAVYYATRPAADAPTRIQTGYISSGKDTPRTIETLETAAPVRIAAGQYFDTLSIVTSTGALSTIKMYEDFPASDSTDPIKATQSERIITPEAVQLLSFKANGRFIALQQGRTQTIYDLDLSKQTDVPLFGATSDSVRQIEWLDSFHFWDDASSSARHYEFDGTNQHALTSVAPGFSAAYSQNKEFFYSIGKTDNGYSLQRTRLLVD